MNFLYSGLLVGLGIVLLMLYHNKHGSDGKFALGIVSMGAGVLWAFILLVNILAANTNQRMTEECSSVMRVVDTQQDSINLLIRVSSCKGRYGQSLLLHLTERVER